MKYSRGLIPILALLGAIRSQADDVLPRRFNFDRYSAMVDKSPFAIATAAVLPEATPDFAKDLYVANAAHSPEGDLVTIASTSDKNFKKYLSTKEPVDGYGIVNIEWSQRVGSTKVTLSRIEILRLSPLMRRFCRNGRPIRRPKRSGFTMRRLRRRRRIGERSKTTSWASNLALFRPIS
jgi:hypothetical protein